MKTLEIPNAHTDINVFTWERCSCSSVKDWVSTVLALLIELQTLAASIGLTSRVSRAMHWFLLIYAHFFANHLLITLQILKSAATHMLIIH